MTREPETGTLYNMVVLVIGTFVSRAGLELALILVARHHGASAFGIFASALALVNMFIIHADLGMSQYMIAAGAPNKNLLSSCLGNTFVVFFIFSLMLCPLMVGLDFVLGRRGDELWVIGILSGYAVGMAGERIGLAILQIYGRTSLSGYIKTVRSIILIALVSLTTWLDRSLWLTALAFAATYILVCGMYLICASRDVVPRANLRLLPEMLRSSFNFWMLDFLIQVYMYFGIILLGFVSSDAVVGNYAAASRVILALIMLPSTLAMVILPRMYEAAVASRDALRTIYERFSKYVFAIGLPAGVGLLLLAPWISSLLFPSRQFTQTSLALQILAPIVVLKFPCIIAGLLILALGHVKRRLAIVAVAAGEWIFVGLILMRYFGLVGACVTNLIVEISIAFGYFYVTAKKGYSLPFYNLFSKPMLAAAVMGTFLYLIRQHVGLGITIPTGAAVYIVSLLLTRFISITELKSITPMKCPDWITL